MRLEPLLRPVGPLPPAVYWRRRGVAVAAVLLVLLLLALSVRALAGGEDRVVPADRAAPAPVPPGSPAALSPGAASPSPTAQGLVPGTPSASPASGSRSASPAAGQATTEPHPSPDGSRSPAAAAGGCAPDDLEVRLQVSPAAAAVGEDVRFDVEVGTRRPCALDVGPVARAVQVRSDGEHVWSTEDCEAGDASAPTVLQPDAPLTLTVTWGGDRTAPGCPPGLPAPEPGEHTAVAQVGPARSAAVVFRLR